MDGRGSRRAHGNHVGESALRSGRLTRRNRIQGGHSGGSGFLVHVPSAGHQELRYPYAVTNRHLIDNGYRFLRLNTNDGRLHIVPSEPEAWRLHPDGDDVAILALELDWTLLKWFSIGTEDFVSPEIMAEYRLGPGDEVFLKH